MVPIIVTDTSLEAATAEVRRVAVLASITAAGTKSCEFGSLGGQLCFLQLRRTPQTGALDKKSRNVLSILRNLCLCDKVSSLTTSVDIYHSSLSTSSFDVYAFISDLAAVSDEELKHTFKRLAERPDARRDTLSVTGGRILLRNLLKTIEGEQTVAEKTVDIELDQPLPTEDYNSSLNEEVYDAVSRYVHSCRLPTAERAHACSGHSLRLCLNNEFRTSDDNVLFKMLISGSMESRAASTQSYLPRWQQVGLILQDTRKSFRHIQFADEGEGKVVDLRNAPKLTTSGAAQSSTTISPTEFCKLVSDSQKGNYVLTVYVQRKEFLKSGTYLDANLLDRSDSISLAELLRDYDLTIETRLVLAYMIAQSVWRFYNSKWMRTRWSSRSIHIVREQSPWDGEQQPQVYVHNLCFAVQFDTRSAEILETFTGVAASSYPRVLALGRLLIELGSQQTLGGVEDEAGISQEAQINDDAGRCSRVLRNVEWPSFDTMNEEIREEYRRITKLCCDRNLFSTNTSTGTTWRTLKTNTTVLSTPTARRQILYKDIVAPLKRLLDKTSYGDTVNRMREILQRKQDSVIDQKGMKFLNNRKLTWDCLHPGRASSQKWLLNIQQTYEEIGRRHRKQFRSPSHKRTRIAILDTGYDDGDHLLPNLKRSRRIKGYVDYVSEGTNPVDEDGHGTRILALVMKLAPFADIYVARVAKGSIDLANCEKNVVSAIRWASERGCSVISMSFGFDKSSFPIYNAISFALTHTDRSLLFFAAAGNDAGNSRGIMFPASHEQVIPIYGTNAAGTWSESLNPPRMHEGSNFFATLAEDVPCYHIETEDEPMEEVYATGTSFATAIAAGLAATLLEYAALAQISPTDCSESETSWQNLLCRRKAMVELFKEISDLRNDNWRYLNPLRFFGEDDKTRQDIIATALRRSRY